MNTNNEQLVAQYDHYYIFSDISNRYDLQSIEKSFNCYWANILIKSLSALLQMADLSFLFYFPISLNGAILNTTIPSIACISTKPNVRLSLECVRLSPKTK